VVFQDPCSSLNPRLSIRDITGEPLVNYGVSGGHKLEDRVQELVPAGAISRRTALT
jgi:peptide/nickel transport system ATP-binding protein